MGYKPPIAKVGITDDYNDLDNLPTLGTMAAQNTGSFVPSTRTVNTKALSVDISLTKSDVGLSNVDNTSDLNKPISTATQTALNIKANSATTLAGYGITDAYPLSGNPSNFLTVVTLAQITTALGYTPYNATNPNSYVTQAGARTAISLTTTGTAGTATYNNSTGILNVPVIPSAFTLPYKTYQAILSQSGTSAPTGTVYNNDFGATTFTWARTVAGTYTVTASAPTFTTGKTVVITSVEGGSLQKYAAIVNSTTQITLTTSVTSILTLILTGVLTDGILSNTLIEVRVYT